MNCLSRLQKFHLTVLAIFSFSAMSPSYAQDFIKAEMLEEGEILVNNRVVRDIQVAFNMVTDNGFIKIGPGIYRQAGELKRNGVIISGSKGTHFVDTITKGKATFVIKGSNTIIKNIECSGAKAEHNNGSCIRAEGKNLKVMNVYFHDSQSGILTSGKVGTLEVVNSRFERIGKKGRAHAIYMNGDKLAIRRSVFISAKDQAHEIKSRAAVTIIQNSIVASLDGDDSRLIDVPNGGEVIIRDNMLIEGPGSVNYELLSWGVEGVRHKKNKFSMTNNLIITDREAGSYLLGIHKSLDYPTASGNVLVGFFKRWVPEDNILIKSREEFGFGPHPELPYWPATDRAYTMLKKMMSEQSR
ncbi:hypothetical protein QGN29_06340 [Temperatibacter marinus]|uniref:Right handed beta helix domain-containing protein n=1 Tax=Temperatibacter marinus TaxID=1456591 RepID=A0AA52EEG8_9PROT|nr:hypothetical protein [Temperatibacter marinus]WND03992.1 hypothetical protein QGN29_06340 [Temperatibacter marinus]